MTTAVMERSGWVLFATTMFVIVGVLDIIFGLTMIINNEWIVFGAKEVWYLDISAWGWITFIVGALALVVAWGVYAGQTWARVVGIIVAVLAVIDATHLMRTPEHLQAAVLPRRRIDGDHDARHVGKQAAVEVPVAVVLVPLPRAAHPRFLGAEF